ncbi:MAG: LCP family protein [Kouleothrix sp.]|nr:LCP family protein [Kouleothrix sp.]
MTFSRRRLVRGTLVAILVLVTLPAIWLGIKWNRALTNVDKMIVTPAALPQATSEAQPALGDTSSSDAASAPEPTAMPIPAPDGAMNILLLGSDGRIGEDISRTDTIVWVHLDGRTNHVSMLSLPRDLWVNIPGYGKNKINAAYGIGERKIGLGYGPALLKKTVSELVGLPIDHFVMINFQGFKTLIDKIGGIYVDVPKAIDDDKYPMDAYEGDVRTMKIHFDAGEQLLDGDQALIYSRTRHADSDFGRNQRQQQVLMAIFDRVRQQGLFGQLTNLDEYTDALSDYVRTDLSRGQMLRLASMGSKLNAEGIQRYAIDPSMVVEQRQPAYVLVLNDKKSLKRLVNQMIDPTVATAGGEDPMR